VARLEEKGLRPSAEAAKRTLLRRHGERWGRHWLDVARYADTKGYVFFQESAFPWAWTYRDYVVRAFNDDLPYDHTDLAHLIEDIRPAADPAEQRRQLDLVRRLNELHRARSGADDRLEARIQAFELAFRMQREAEEAFDYRREPLRVRERYGAGVHGRQLLITRRLLERGVRFVQVWSGVGQPWDNHDNIANNHRNLAGQWDGPLAAFLDHLKARGLFDRTLVMWGGEFGRTPVAELPGLSGRDHNHYGFTMWLAGGGVQGGLAYGSTDDFGFQAVGKKVHVHDLHATILHCLGFDHERLTYRYAGRDFRLTDVHGHVVKEVLA
jgi:arylsulfatase A-like enzyme